MKGKGTNSKKKKNNNNLASSEGERSNNTDDTMLSVLICTRLISNRFSRCSLSAHKIGIVEDTIEGTQEKRTHFSETRQHRCSFHFRFTIWLCEARDVNFDYILYFNSHFDNKFFFCVVWPTVIISSITVILFPVFSIGGVVFFCVSYRVRNAIW